ncbi:MAG: hypothetical protein AB1758_31815, partial [Candidatus Eremiobacterota bacterium]
GVALDCVLVAMAMRRVRRPPYLAALVASAGWAALSAGVTVGLGLPGLAVMTSVGVGAGAFFSLAVNRQSSS